MRLRSGLEGAAGVALLSLAAGCGGGGPLLHPAHVLPSGDVSFAAGSSGRFGLGGLHRAERRLDESAAIPGGATTPEEQANFAKGAIARFAVAPGVAPFVAARVGLEGTNEAGISYTGRGVRIDGRHAFQWKSYALSLGLGAAGAMGRPASQPDERVEDMSGRSGLRSVSLASVSGYGLDVPVLFGWRSDADVVQLWAGLRGGVERDHFLINLLEDGSAVFGSEGDATRFWGGGLVGFSVGLAPIEVRVEVNAAYENARGTLRTRGGDVSGNVAGLSLTPAMGISAKF